MKFLILLSLLGLGMAIPEPLTNNIIDKDTCPKALPPLPGFEFPHLIVPISKAHPDLANPNSFSPSITPSDLATVFNFDILHGDQSCELGFYFPRQDQLETSSFTFSGPGTFTVEINKRGEGAQVGVTTWNKQPGAGMGPPTEIIMAPGNYYSLFKGACPEGLWSITISSLDTIFYWFQDFDLCPIGPFVVYNGSVQG
jgi:hypothetical protein